MSGFGCTKDKLYMSIKQMRFTMPFTISIWHTLDFYFFDVGRKIMPIVIQDKDESMLLLV